MAKVGKPLIYKTPEELEARIFDYFKNGAYVEVGLSKDNLVKKYAPTLCGLILWLGFSCKDTFYEYGKKPEYADSIKKARLMIEEMYERNLTTQYSTGSIFALKNFGWEDTQKIDHTIKGFLFAENERKTVEDLQRESIELAEKIIANRRGTTVSSQN